jgi:RND family efflux transporter MFP subunit
MMTKRALPYIAIGSAVLLAPLIGVFTARLSAAAPAPSSAKVAVSAAPLSTSTAAPMATDFVGVVLPPQMASLSPRADGKVLETKVKLGQAVKKGDVLVVFDPREREHELAMAEASLKAAKASAGAAGADLAAATRRASRRNSTVTVGDQKIAIVSGEEAAQSRFEAQGAAARAASAAANIAEQRAKVDQLKLALEQTQLVAPFDGVVTGLYFEPGMTVHAGDPAARVVGGKGLRFRAAVPEDSVAVLKGKAHARITLEGKLLVGSIEQVAPEVEPASRTFLVEGPVDNGDAACGGDCTMLAGRAVRVTLAP